MSLRFLTLLTFELNPMSIVLLVVEITVIGLGVFHIIHDLRSRKRNEASEKPYQLTFKWIIITLVLLVSLAMLAMMSSNQRLLYTIRTYASLIQTGIVLTFLVSFLSILFGTIGGVILALLIAKG